MSPYRPQSMDTHEKSDRMYFDLIRQLTPAQCIQRTWEANEWAWSRARIGLRNQFPAADEREIELRLAALKYGRELVLRAFQWDADAHRHEHATA